MPTTSNPTGRQNDVTGVRKSRLVLYTGPSSYVTGGDSFTAADVDLGTLEHAPDFLAWNGSAVRLVVYDYTNSKYVWYVPNTGAEVANGVDLSAFAMRIILQGY